LDGHGKRNGLWWYEGIAFTWFGRLEETPNQTGGLEISFDELPAPVTERILSTLGVPISAGMKRTKLEQE
jgi:hypothetical protein